MHGTKGSFIKSGEDPQEAKLRAGILPNEDLGKETEATYGLLHTEINGNISKETVPSEVGDYSMFYEDVYNTIIHSNPFPYSRNKLTNVIKIIELAEESSGAKRTVSCEGLMK